MFSLKLRAFQRLKIDGWTKNTFLYWMAFQGWPVSCKDSNPFRFPIGWKPIQTIGFHERLMERQLTVCRNLIIANMLKIVNHQCSCFTCSRWRQQNRRLKNQWTNDKIRANFYISLVTQYLSKKKIKSMLHSLHSLKRKMFPHVSFRSADVASSHGVFAVPWRDRLFLLVIYQGSFNYPFWGKSNYCKMFYGDFLRDFP